MASSTLASTSQPPSQSLSTLETAISHLEEIYTFEVDGKYEIYCVEAAVGWLYEVYNALVSANRALPKTKQGEARIKQDEELRSAVAEVDTLINELLFYLVNTLHLTKHWSSFLKEEDVKLCKDPDTGSRPTLESITRLLARERNYARNAPAVLYDPACLGHPFTTYDEQELCYLRLGELEEASRRIMPRWTTLFPLNINEMVLTDDSRGHWTDGDTECRRKLYRQGRETLSTRYQNNETCKTLLQIFDDKPGVLTLEMKNYLSLIFAGSFSELDTKVAKQKLWASFEMLADTPTAVFKKIRERESKRPIFLLRETNPKDFEYVERIQKNMWCIFTSAWEFSMRPHTQVVKKMWNLAYSILLRLEAEVTAEEKKREGEGQEEMTEAEERKAFCYERASLARYAIEAATSCVLWFAGNGSPSPILDAVASSDIINLVLNWLSRADRQQHLLFKEESDSLTMRHRMPCACKDVPIRRSNRVFFENEGQLCRHKCRLQALIDTCVHIFINTALCNFRAGATLPRQFITDQLIPGIMDRLIAGFADVDKENIPRVEEVLVTTLTKGLQKGKFLSSELGIVPREAQPGPYEGRCVNIDQHLVLVVKVMLHRIASRVEIDDTVVAVFHFLQCLTQGKPYILNKLIPTAVLPTIKSSYFDSPEENEDRLMERLDYKNAGLKEEDERSEASNMEEEEEEDLKEEEPGAEEEREEEEEKEEKESESDAESQEEDYDLIYDMFVISSKPAVLSMDVDIGHQNQYYAWVLEAWGAALQKPIYNDKFGICYFSRKLGALLFNINVRDQVLECICSLFREERSLPLPRFLEAIACCPELVKGIAFFSLSYRDAKGIQLLAAAQEREAKAGTSNLARHLLSSDLLMRILWLPFTQMINQAEKNLYTTAGAYSGNLTQQRFDEDFLVNVLKLVRGIAYSVIPPPQVSAAASLAEKDEDSQPQPQFDFCFADEEGDAIAYDAGGILSRVRGHDCSDEPKREEDGSQTLAKATRHERVFLAVEWSAIAKKLWALLKLQENARVASLCRYDSMFDLQLESLQFFAQVLLSPSVAAGKEKGLEIVNKFLEAASCSNLSVLRKWTCKAFSVFPNHHPDREKMDLCREAAGEVVVAVERVLAKSESANGANLLGKRKTEDAEMDVALRGYYEKEAKLPFSGVKPAQFSLVEAIKKVKAFVKTPVPRLIHIVKRSQYIEYRQRHKQEGDTIRWEPLKSNRTRTFANRFIEMKSVVERAEKVLNLLDAENIEGPKRDREYHYFEVKIIRLGTWEVEERVAKENREKGRRNASTKGKKRTMSSAYKHMGAISVGVAVCDMLEDSWMGKAYQHSSDKQNMSIGFSSEGVMTMKCNYFDRSHRSLNPGDCIGVGVDLGEQSVVFTVNGEVINVLGNIGEIPPQPLRERTQKPVKLKRSVHQLPMQGLEKIRLGLSILDGAIVHINGGGEGGDPFLFDFPAWRATRQSMRDQYKSYFSNSANFEPGQPLDDFFKLDTGNRILTIPDIFGAPSGIGASLVRSEAVPKELSENLALSLARLSQRKLFGGGPDGGLIFRPGTNRQVRDLAHPSLYPFIEGVSLPDDPDTCHAIKKCLTLNRHTLRFPCRGNIIADELCNTGQMPHRWLPTNVFINADGKATFQGYVNNIDSALSQDVLQGLEQLFSLFVPLFEHSLGYIATVDSFGDSRDQRRRLVELLQGQDDGTHRPRARSLRSTNVQVVVSISDIVIRPSDAYESRWEGVGLPQDKIIATGLYYVDSPIPEIPEEREPTSLKANTPSIALRGNREIKLRPDQRFTYHIKSIMQPLTCTISLPKIPFKPGTMLTFTNHGQYKFQDFSNNHSKQTIVRRVVAFHLVDPICRLISTDLIPEQQSAIELTIMLLDSVLNAAQATEEKVQQKKEKQRKTSASLKEAEGRERERIPVEILLRIAEFAHPPGMRFTTAQNHQLKILREHERFHAAFSDELEQKLPDVQRHYTYHTFQDGIL